MMKKTILISAFVLNGSRSGYRRIIRNLVLSCLDNQQQELNGKKIIFLFQNSGWSSLDIDIDFNHDYSTFEVILFDDFKSKWARGVAEQLIVPYFAIKFKVDRIFMPATFGLLLPVKKTITFIHTNTSFSVDKKMRGRSKFQQLAHNMLLRLTAITSFKLLFTTRQTYEEFSNYIGHKFPELLLGNGLISLECEKSISDYHPCLSYESYLLSVSQVYRLKNFDSLIRAFLLLKKSGELQNLSLVIVGTIQELDYYNELKFLADNRDDIIFLHDIKDDYLNCLYDSCKAYCFYSYFEGYSLTPAEAMLHNKHVAISKIPTHLEVYGEEPVYAIPADLVAIKNSILEVIARAEHGKPIYSKGFIERFSFNSFLKRLIDWVL